MATIPEDFNEQVDNSGLIGGSGVTVQKTVAAVMNNAPIFGVGNRDLQGYVSVKVYEQVTASIINGDAPKGGTYQIVEGKSYASGKPYVTAEGTFAQNINMANT